MRLVSIGACWLLAGCAQTMAPVPTAGAVASRLLTDPTTEYWKRQEIFSRQIAEATQKAEGGRMRNERLNAAIVAKESPRATEALHQIGTCIINRARTLAAASREPADIVAVASVSFCRSQITAYGQRRRAALMPEIDDDAFRQSLTRNAVAVVVDARASGLGVEHQ